MTATAHKALDTTTEVGAAIYQLAWRARVTQAELGQAIGVAQSTMSQKLRGSTPITVDELVALAARLDVDPRDLLPLPRLDSNQQPSGLVYPQVRRLSLVS